MSDQNTDEFVSASDKSEDSGFSFIQKLLDSRRAAMSERLEETFEHCLESVRYGYARFNPTQSEKLHLYGLSQQAIHGDAQGEGPDPSDVVPRAKFMAWKNCQGMTQIEAMQQYVNIVKYK